jgi:uncharacterized peroxidase-related enzyme
MIRVEPVTLNETDTQTAATLQQVKAKLGRLPNLIGTLARAPAALDGYLKLAEAAAGGRLSARQRELIAIAVAQENGCEYCLSAHAAIGKSVGLHEEDIDRARRGHARSPTDDAITALALAVVRARGGVTDGELEAVRQAGVDDGIIIEIVANVALHVMTNYVNRLAGTALDFPVYRLRAAA